MHQFRIPKCKEVNYREAFKSSMNTVESIGIIERLEKCTKQLSQALSFQCDYQSILTIIEEYLPNLFHLMESLKGQNKVRADCDINFEWIGSFVVDMKGFHSTDIIFEILMVMHTKAVIHYSRAKYLIENDILNFLPQAGKDLLAASSTIDYVGKCVSTKWNKVFNQRIANPPELNAYLNYALSILFKSNAQALSVIKVINNEVSTPPTLIAKLCIAVLNSSIESVKHINPVKDLLLSSELLTNAAVSRDMFEGMTYMYLAQAAYDKNETGLSLRYCEIAKVFYYYF
jgi:hypothetical protein